MNERERAYKYWIGCVSLLVAVSTLLHVRFESPPQTLYVALFYWAVVLVFALASIIMALFGLWLFRKSAVASRAKKPTPLFDQYPSGK